MRTRHLWQPTVCTETNFFHIEGVCGGESHLRNFGGTGVSSSGAEISDKRETRKLETAAQSLQEGGKWRFRSLTHWIRDPNDWYHSYLTVLRHDGAIWLLCCFAESADEIALWVVCRASHGPLLDL